MSFLKGNIKNILIVAIVFLAAFYAYTTFFMVDEGNLGPLVPSEPTPSEEAGKDLLAILSDLRTLRLDDSIFSDPTFRSLRNFRVELSPEPVGRSDPFSPIGASGAQVAR